MSLILQPLIHVLEIGAEIDILNLVRIDSMNERKVFLYWCFRFDLYDFKIVELFLDPVIVWNLIFHMFFNHMMPFVIIFIKVLDRLFLSEQGPFIILFFVYSVFHSLILISPSVKLIFLVLIKWCMISFIKNRFTSY